VQRFHTMPPILMGRRAAKIAGRKGKADAARAKVFGKIGKQIIAAAKAGGSSSAESNQQLADVLKKAKEANVPKDLIDRNLKRASDTSVGNFSELTYEAYGHGGVGVVIESLTDNNNRTNSDVRDVVKKAGGKMAESGSVMFQFTRQGALLVSNCTEEELFDVALEGGAEDVIALPKGGFKVVTEPANFGSVRDALLARQFEVDEENSGLTMAPVTLIETSDEDYEANVTMLERLLELDDVDCVFCNQEDGEDEDEE